ncbi:MAG TPA: acyl-CoA dehydrogenase family protein [Rhizomicrobium sp.]|nr:acyl-CoA dehydrogenase family protein [Rhizomicrobium sp.]
MAILTEEQILLRDAAKSFVAEKAPVARFRKLRDAGKTHDPALWRDMCEMGWSGILIPEEFGGSGLGYFTLGLVLEETGRTLAPSPLLSSAIAATALLLGGDEAQKSEWLAKFTSGEAIGTLAADEAAHHAPEKIALFAARDGADFKLNGKKVFVADGGIADVFVVPARTAKGITLFLVPAGAAGLTRREVHSVDSRNFAMLEFKDVRASEILGAPDQGASLLDSILDRARAALAAEILGAASQSFDVTLDYLKTRTQFGQAIGTFQALQHRAAKMFTEIELARSCVEAALNAIDKNANDIAQLCALAKARAGDLWHLVSNEMVQMHGGIGMTDAHDAGLYLKRARVAEALYGNSAFQRDRYARLMGY